MRRLRPIAFAVVAAAAAASCASETLTVAETDLVITVKNPEADYSALHTYALTDTVTDLCSIDPPDGGFGGFGGRAGLDGLGGLGGRPGAGDAVQGAKCDPLPERFDDDVLDAIERNMDDLGYQRVDSDAKPDVTILVGTVVRKDWYYVPGYAWCDPFYYYYCWYPPTGYVYEFSTGSVLINMIDGASDPTELTSLWFAGLNGLYESSSQVSGAERISLMVDRAFAQSPFLSEGGAQ